jgi:hypothetical protein
MVALDVIVLGSAAVGLIRCIAGAFLAAEDDGLSALS